MKKTLAANQFVGFIIIGGIAAFVNFSSRIIYNQWVNYSFSIFLAYVTGMFTAFLLMKTFLFTSSKQKNITSVFFFTMVNLAAVLQTWAISLVLQKHVLIQVGFNVYVNEIAHAIGIMIPVFSSYIGHKHLSFK